MCLCRLLCVLQCDIGAGWVGIIVFHNDIYDTAPNPRENFSTHELDNDNTVPYSHKCSRKENVVIRNSLVRLINKIYARSTK